MNYQKALHNEQDISPQGGSKMFIWPLFWLVFAFAVIAVSASLSSNLF